jgi:N,N'-diacetyllegionaminate synthase
MNFGNIDVDFVTEQRAPIILAEVGVNHNRSLDIAKQLVDVAVEAGADVVKFQRFISEEEISIYADKADYQKETTGSDGGQLEMCKALEFPDEYLIEMKAYCESKNIGYLVTAFEPNSVDWLVDVLGMKTLKIPSSETSNIPMLEQIGRKGVAAILSTGASYAEEVIEAVAALKRGYIEAGVENPDIVVLHCVSQYPAPDYELNLKVIKTLADITGCPVGWSDHSLGITADIVATALGAVIIEKHFTLDQNMEGPDHRASVEPAELKALVQETRRAFSMLGDAKKQPVMSESGTRPLIKKSAVAVGNLPAGTVISFENVKFKRPCPENAITPAQIKDAIGLKLVRDMKDDQPITWDDVQARA